MNLSLAGRSIRIETTSSRALAAIGPAFAHLDGARPGAGDEILWTIGEEADGWRPDEWGPAGAYRIRSGGFAVVQHDPPAVESFLPGAGIALHTTTAGLGVGDFLAHPASFGLAAALSGPTRQVLHAGAVAVGGAAVLLVGSGGVGKSTTALACAMRGAGFLGDDLVLVEAGDGGGAVAHCLFATAKLNQDSAAMLDAAAWEPIGITPKNKAVVALGNRVNVVRSAPIAAMVVLAPAVARGPRPEPVAAAAAMTLVMPTAIPVACRTGSPADLLRVVAGLCRSVPAFRLPVSWDLEGLCAAVRSIAGAAVAGSVRRQAGRA